MIKIVLIFVCLNMSDISACCSVNSSGLSFSLGRGRYLHMPLGSLAK